MLAQALMKRCIADIPIVQHIQKESGGMNKLYSQSMCSVKQWKAYQAAENMVSAEVDEVRAEADEIEPGWSQVIWRQAMQYHQMLKQRQEAEEREDAERRRAHHRPKQVLGRNLLAAGKGRWGRGRRVRRGAVGEEEGEEEENATKLHGVASARPYLRMISG